MIRGPRRRILALLCAAATAMAFLAACGDEDGGTTGPSAVGGTSSAPPEQESAPPEAAPAEEMPASGPATRSASVAIVDFDYEPKTVKVQAGGEIRFTNQDAARHTATVTEGQVFDTGDMAKGVSKTVILNQPGTYDYICLFHPFMTGTVEVVQ